jgi:hypothetical protein
MNVVLLLICLLFIVLVYVQFCQREAFSFEMKTSLDGNMFKSINRGAASITDGISSQARKMTYAMTSVIPFKHKIREWSRNVRGRNM